MCDHEVVTRIEKIPPPRQAGPYVRWFCNEQDCAMEFKPMPGPGPVTAYLRAKWFRLTLSGVDKYVVVQAALTLIVVVWLVTKWL